MSFYLEKLDVDNPQVDLILRDILSSVLSSLTRFCKYSFLTLISFLCFLL